MTEANYGDVVKVDDGVWAVYLCDYENGKMTTAGLYEDVVNEEGPVTWHSVCADELPVDWPERLWKDSQGNTQKIRQILWDRYEDGILPVFDMANGFVSDTVTEVE